MEDITCEILTCGIRRSFVTEIHGNGNEREFLNEDRDEDVVLVLIKNAEVVQVLKRL